MREPVESVRLDGREQALVLATRESSLRNTNDSADIAQVAPEQAGEGF
jgi:hypothetical protein